MDIALDPATNDIYVDADTGRLATVDGAALVAQRLRIRLNRHIGTWMWDLTRGIPWTSGVFVRSPDLGVIGAYFKKEILGTAGVKRLDAFDISVRDDKLFVDFVVIVDDESDTALRASGPISTSDPGDVDPLAFYLNLLIRPLGPIL